MLAGGVGTAELYLDLWMGNDPESCRPSALCKKVAVLPVSRRTRTTKNKTKLQENLEK